MSATADTDAVRLARVLLERELADIEGQAAALEDDSPERALSRAGMYLGLVAADLAGVAAGPLTERQAAQLGDVQRALAGLLRALTSAEARA